MSDNLRKWIAQHRRLLLWLGGYTVFFFLLAWRKYVAMNSNSGDAWAMLEAFHSTLRGKLMYIPCYEMSYFGNHASPIVLWVVPLFWVMPTAGTLYFAQSLSIGLRNPVLSPCAESPRRPARRRPPDGRLFVLSNSRHNAR